MTHAPLRDLAAIFFRLVNFTFGGGDPTMAALERELVERRRWLNAERYALAYGLARVTPGTNVLAFSAAVAWFLRGWAGAVLAVVAGTIPCTVAVVWLTFGYQFFKSNLLAQHAITGMLAAAVGMMLAAAWNLIRPAIQPGGRIRAIVLAGAAAALIMWGMAPVPVLALSALAGALWQGPEAK